MIIDSSPSGEKLIRKKSLGFVSEYLNSDQDEDFNEDDYKQFLKTPVSDKLRHQSVSIFFSKTIYPISLKVIEDSD